MESGPPGRVGARATCNLSAGHGVVGQCLRGLGRKAAPLVLGAHGMCDLNYRIRPGDLPGRRAGSRQLAGLLRAPGSLCAGRRSPRVDEDAPALYPDQRENTVRVPRIVAQPFPRLNFVLCHDD